MCKLINFVVVVVCCFKGTTKLLLTRIPFYRDVIISSFSCEHCNYQNNGIESANKIQERGVRYKLLVANEKDLNREVVKSDNGTFQIPLIDFEIPPRTQKGSKYLGWDFDFRVFNINKNYFKLLLQSRGLSIGSRVTLKKSSKRKKWEIF